MASAATLPALFDLSGRVAVVTGGCQNFGAEIAQGLGECGARLAVTSRDAAKAEKHAAELGKHGIRVNAVSPGGFRRAQPQAFIDNYSRRTMLGRMGQDGQDLKGPVAFLASDAASYVTGHNLMVDGGFTRFK